MKKYIILICLLFPLFVKAQVTAFSPMNMSIQGYKNVPIGIVQPNDSVLIAIAKLQAQINALKGATYTYIGHGIAATIQSDNTAGANTLLSPLFFQWLDNTGAVTNKIGITGSNLNFFITGTSTYPVNLSSPSIKLSGLTYSLPTSDAVSSQFIVTPSGSTGGSSYLEFGFNGFSSYLGNARIGAITRSTGGGDLVFQTKIGSGSIWTNQVMVPRAGGILIYNMPNAISTDSVMLYRTTLGATKAALGTSLSVGSNIINTIQDIRTTSTTTQFTNLGLGIVPVYKLDVLGSGASLARFATSGTSPSTGSSSVLIDNSTVNSNTSASFALQIKVASSKQTTFNNDGTLTISALSTAGLLTNTSAGLIGTTTALPSGTTATTQTALDNTTKVATTAYTDAAITAYKTAVAVETNKDLTSVTNTFPTFNQNTTGSAAKWTTGRTLSLTGDGTYTSPSFDGSGNVTAAFTLATVNSNVGTFNNVTVNGKGLVTAASNVSYVTGVTSANTDIGVSGTTAPVLTFNRSLALITPTNIYTTSATPTFSAGAAAGTSPTITVTGNNKSGVISVTIGTLPAPTSPLVTITMNGLTLPNKCIAHIAPIATTSLAVSNEILALNFSPTGFDIYVNGVALTAGTYQWSYIIEGN